MAEDLTKWLVVAGVITLVVIWPVVGHAAEKARRRHFAQLATHFGADMEIRDRTLRFVAEIDGRSFEIRDGYSGGGAGSQTTAVRYVTFSTPLRGPAWDLHDVKITPRRRRAEFEERFRIEQFGLPLPDRWLSDDVRAAITSLSSDAKPEILIEGGHLVYRTMDAIRDFSPERLGNCLRKQGALAGVLERSR